LLEFASQHSTSSPPRAVALPIPIASPAASWDTSSPITGAGAAGRVDKGRRPQAQHATTAASAPTVSAGRRGLTHIYAMPSRRSLASASYRAHSSAATKWPRQFRAILEF
jgi:hypothetical protein